MRWYISTTRFCDSTAVYETLLAIFNPYIIQMSITDRENGIMSFVRLIIFLSRLVIHVLWWYGRQKKTSYRVGQIQWLEVQEFQELRRTSTFDKKIIALEETERENYDSLIQITKRL